MNDSKKTLEFKFERTISASPSEVFDAWLDPKVPGNPWNAAEKLILNPKVDGLFFWALRGTPQYGRFVEVARPDRIRHTWVSPNTLGVESTVTVTFEKKGTDTLMTLVHSDLPDDEKARSHEKGWNYFLGIFPEQFGKGSTSKKPKDFSLTFDVKTSSKETMKRIGQVDLWWAKNFKGQANKLNDEFSVYFGDTYVDFRISEVVPEKKVVWLVTDCNLHWIDDKKEWKNTEVAFTLSEKDGKTTVDFVHKGVTPESECYESCAPGWTHHLEESLLKLIDLGQGFPE